MSQDQMITDLIKLIFFDVFAGLLRLIHLPEIWITRIIFMLWVVIIVSIITFVSVYARPKPITVQSVMAPNPNSAAGLAYNSIVYNPNKGKAPSA